MYTEIAYQTTTDSFLYIPDGIKIIRNAYHEGWGRNHLEEISFPSSLVCIENAFAWCNKLKKITFRDGVNPDLKLDKKAFDAVFVADTAEQLLDLDAPDIIKCYIFTKDFYDYHPNMKQPVLLAYLAGKPASGTFEEAIKRYAKKDFQNLFYYFCGTNDAGLFSKYLDLFKPDKKTFELLTRSLETAQSCKAVAISAAITEYLDRHCGTSGSKKVSDDLKLKDLGLKERTIADWKKIFRLKETDQGYMITKYIGQEPKIEVPEYIGQKPVIAFAEGAFTERHVTSIETPVSPYLSDFFGDTFFPDLYVYGHTELQKKVRVKDLKAAAVDQFVSFGSYPADSTDGRRQPIVWRVVDIDGNVATLISRSRIEVLPMHTYRTSVTWEKCALRKWLNELFYPFAFSDQEKQQILKVEIPNPPNPEYKTSSGRDTEDYVYLPGVDEAEKYGVLIHRGGRWDIPEYRGYNAEQEWYRTNGRYSTCFATYVSKLDKYNGLGCDELAGVRPMIQVRISD